MDKYPPKLFKFYQNQLFWKFRTALWKFQSDLSSSGWAKSLKIKFLALVVRVTKSCKQIIFKTQTSIEKTFLLNLCMSIWLKSLATRFGVWEIGKWSEARRWKIKNTKNHFFKSDFKKKTHAPWVGQKVWSPGLDFGKLGNELSSKMKSSKIVLFLKNLGNSSFFFNLTSEPNSFPNFPKSSPGVQTFLGPVVLW